MVGDAHFALSREAGLCPGVTKPQKMNFAELQKFAESYAGTWCSQKPESVAAFYAQDGALSVNDGPPAVGRQTIAEVARGFMHDLPDMKVTMNKVVADANGIFFHWTLTGTNTGPGGTGKRVRISGYEEWQLSNEGLIANSQGHFDNAVYERQLPHGIDEPE
jgi:predicted ester cyclase